MEPPHPKDPAAISSLQRPCLGNDDGINQPGGRKIILGTETDSFKCTTSS